MEEQTFKYVASYRSIIIISSIFIIVGGIVNLLLWDLSPQILSTMPLPMSIFLGIALLYIIIPTINKSFFIKITFYEDRIVYKSLFNKIILSKELIRDIIWIERASKYTVSSYKYAVDGYPGLGELLMIGKLDTYPLSAFKIAFKPSSSKYITIEYREELDDILNFYMKK